MKKKMQKEKRVYVIHADLIPEDASYKDLRDADFIDYAEAEGTVYSLAGFENAINQDDFDHVNSYIRII
jgi:hypothetical protein